MLPDDIFLVSYPKSGNTWARFLLANLMYPEQNPDFGNIHRLVADPDATQKREFDRMPRPRVIKSHWCFEPRFKRVIYLVRDPRDVAISEYHYQRKTRRIADAYPLEQYVERFVAGTTYEIGSWGQHLLTWVGASNGQPGFLLARYEDMVADPVGQLSRIAAFLDVAATPQQLRAAVERSSAERMRKLEKEKGHLLSLTKGSREDLPFVRAAKSGGWRTDLPEPLIAKIETAWAPLMQHLGYELHTSVRGSAEADAMTTMLHGIRA